jgi:hypothetical protein
MKPTTKIRFTKPQIAFVMRAHPNCNLNRLTELSFEFDQAGRLVDCNGTIKTGGNIDHDYAGSGLALLYERARRRVTAQQAGATILQFPNGARLANAGASSSSQPSHTVLVATNNIGKKKHVQHGVKFGKASRQQNREKFVPKS